MDNPILNQIRDRYLLETSLLRLHRQQEENEAALRQAKFDLREAKVAHIEYGGSFRSFRDKLTGRKEAAEISLLHAVQKAQADLTAAQQKQEFLNRKIPETQTQLSSLPDWNVLRQQAEGAALREWCRLECLYCTEVLEPLLKVTHELLMERRSQFNGTYAGQIRTHQELAVIYSAPEAAGEACKPYLLRLKAALDVLEIPFELYSFFQAPTVFLSSATQYTRMDRINTAIFQTEALLQLIPGLQGALPE